MRRPRRHAGRRAAAGLAGLLAAAAGLAVGEPVAGLVRPESRPVKLIGEAAIDRTPAAVKDWAVRTFGEQDKLVLQLGILLVLAGCAAGVGLSAARHRRAAVAAAAAFGLAGVAAALAAPGGGPADVLPSVAAGAAAAGALSVLAGRLVPPPPEPVCAASDPDRPRPAPPRPAPPPADGAGPDSGAEHRDAGRAAPSPAAVFDPGPGPAAGPPPADGEDRPAFDRRGFLAAASAVAAASAGSGLLGAALLDSSEAAAGRARDGILLPRPASPAAPVPDGAELGIDGLSPFLTPNRDFYRIDTALTVPRIDATAWELRIAGLGIGRLLTLTYRDLLDRELVERDITLTCVSNQVGGPYIGNARWIGIPLAELLREAGVRPPAEGGPADQLVARSVDGMTIGTPVEAVMDGRDALLAVGMNGEPLPFRHGFPVRMVVPGLYGYVSACKWLAELELTTFDAYDAYWVQRGWADRAPVKTQSRIDTPRPLTDVPRGTVTVAGVAWAQRRGIRRVEVRVDDGPWQTARLAAKDTVDTWRQWVWEWTGAEPGEHRLQVRATDAAGRTQTAERSQVAPDGATGHHTVPVTVV
ncbi:DMSO/TMAO reductase YedYZ, molybdopterin-dependent catalytic subunit [Streptomyces aidingensis]|uniref:DMSO/TMAO reductase YedYZ, molybdopterin-dependent catalytic subunit n=1 Tax=Streptomyces aidingensis TaxID=910347 RepID=A0A1I1JAK7_9ACTN|nr:DMSO/TMAO reductase YedYZ, molybdopterin-dependent catalytic subunit [Streptomyces aidingensis]